MKHVRKFFKKSGIILTVVPSYIGGFMSLVWSSNKLDMKTEKSIKRKIKIDTTYYNEEIRIASTITPNFMKLI